MTHARHALFVSAPLWVAAALVGCASTPDGDTGLGDPETIFAREGELPPPIGIEGPEGRFTAQVRGQLVEPMERYDGYAFGAFDIGLSSSIACFVFDETLDPAHAVVGLSDNFFERVQADVPALERQVQTIRADAVEGVPYIGLDWLLSNEGVVSQWRVYAGNHGDRGLACQFDQSGYQQTFERFFREFLASLPPPANPARFREVASFSVNEQRIGYSLVEMWVDAEGDYEIVSTQSLLIASGPDTIGATDDRSVEFSFPDGTLINAFSYSLDDSPATRLSLKSAGNGLWEASGTLQAKPFEAQFESNALRSSLFDYRLTRRAAQGELTGTHRFDHWLGTAAPDTAVPVEFEVVSPTEVTTRLAGLSTSSEIDELGAHSATIDYGHLEMVVERLFVDGSF